MLVGRSLSLLTSPHMYVGSSPDWGGGQENSECALAACSLAALSSPAGHLTQAHHQSGTLTFDLHQIPAGHVHVLCWFNASSLFSVCPADFELCKPVYPEVLIHKPAWGPFNSGIKKCAFWLYHCMGWITVLLAKPICFLSSLSLPCTRQPPDPITCGQQAHHL